MEGYSLNHNLEEVASVEEDLMELCRRGIKVEGTGPALARCSTKVSTEEEEKAKAAAEAAAKKKGGKGRSVKDSSKRKAASSSSKGKKAATGPPEVEEAPAGSVSEGVNDAADVSVVTAEDTGVEEWVPGQLIEMPKDYVEWILSQKRRVLEEDPDEYYNRMINDPDRPDIYTPEFLEEERQLMRDMAEQHRILGDHVEKFQKWLRIQLDTKGRVLVGESYLAQSIRWSQAFAEEFGALWQNE